MFHYGPADVSMTFNCGVGVVEEFKSVGVAGDLGRCRQQPRTGPGDRGHQLDRDRAPAASPRAPARRRAGATKSSRGGADRRQGRRHDGRPTDPASAGTTNEGTEPIDPSLLGSDPSGAPLAAGAPSAPGDGQLYVEAAVPASGTPRRWPGRPARADRGGVCGWRRVSPQFGRLLRSAQLGQVTRKVRFPKLRGALSSSDSVWSFLPRSHPEDVDGAPRGLCACGLRFATRGAHSAILVRFSGQNVLSGDDARPPAAEGPRPLSPEEVSTSCVITRSW